MNSNFSLKKKYIFEKTLMIFDSDDSDLNLLVILSKFIFRNLIVFDVEKGKRLMILMTLHGKGWMEYKNYLFLHDVIFKQHRA